ncbi:MAG: tripartite tricarboxylate transporter substrate binding protein [Candidatus Hodarchaeota archaeon]
MGIKRTVFCGMVILAISFIFISSSSWGVEKYPNRPITLVIPVGPGGGHDLHSRLMTSVAHQYLGQPMMVEMKPGAGGTIGSAFVARAKPDGYTLLLGGTSFNSITCQREDTGYTKDDFIAIAKINHLNNIVVVPAEKPWKTLEEFLNYMRENPGKLRFGTTSPFGLTGLVNHMLLRKTGIKTAPPTIPYKGVGAQALAMLKGDVDYGVQIHIGLMPWIKSGEFRALATIAEKRLPDLPDVPTAKELGYDVAVNMWLGVLAPKGTPEYIVETLSTAFDNIAKDKSFLTMMKKVGLPLYYENREAFEKYWSEEYKTFGEFMKILGWIKKK